VGREVVKFREVGNLAAQRRSKYIACEIALLRRKEGAGDRGGFKRLANFWATDARGRKYSRRGVGGDGLDDETSTGSHSDHR